MPLVACIAAVTATALVARSRKAQVPVKNLVQLPYIEELKAKAEQGDAQAQCNLAEAYALGKGVVKDDVEKAKWYRNAAYQGNEAAQYALGCAYSHGEGVPKDAIEAVKWWLRSAHQGDLFSAQSSLGCAYYKGEGVAKDQLEAVKWWRKAAEQGDSKSQYDMGHVYEYGEGVPKDMVEAYKWYNLSAATGIETAKQGRARLESQMTSEQIAEAQKLSREFNPRKQLLADHSGHRAGDNF